MDNNSVVLFYSHNYAIWAARVLKDANLKHKIILVPRKHSSDCGYCLQISSSDSEQVISKLTEAGIKYDRIELALI
jgi:hypothetical protein